jgi:leader peptidase (prepilin peptidase)/N-methyltransferase
MSDALLWPTIFWSGVLGVLGLVFGSFIATVAIRWPARRSALSGRSECDGCGRTLTALELVPLVSWIGLRGLCRTCDARIGWSHPLTEALGLAIGVVAGLLAPGLAGAAGAVFGWLLLAAGAVDLAAFRLPNPVTLALAVTGLASGAIGLSPPLFDRACGGIAGFTALWLVATGYRAIRDRDGLGGGDAKLFGAIGLWLGWRALPVVLLIACVLGLAWALLRRMKRDDRLPLGTLLAVGAFALWLWSVTAGCGTSSACLTLPPS